MGFVRTKKKSKVTKTELTEPMKCGHCGNFAPMIRGARYSTVMPVWFEEIGAHLEEGEIYEILDCMSCKRINVTKTHYTELHEFSDMGDEARYIETLFPVNDKTPIGVPEKIQKAYEAAVNVRHIDANAFGVLAGRVLEMICENRKAVGKELYSKLADLATRGEIPGNLVGVAEGLRNLRNVGAHANLGELTKDEVPIVGSLVQAILEYVYSAPHLALIAKERFDKLKRKEVRT